MQYGIGRLASDLPRRAERHVSLGVRRSQERYRCDGLEALGGAQQTVARLDAFLTQVNAGTDRPYLYIGNEPGFNAPWIYPAAGQPWKTQALTRRILKEAYAPTPGSLPGNDDLGATSSWLVWAMLGAYPAVPGVGGLVLGSPVFPKTTLFLGGGKSLVITATEVSNTAIYVQSVKVNGETADPARIPWDKLAGGGTLEMQMGNSPAGAPEAEARDPRDQRMVTRPDSWAIERAPILAPRALLGNAPELVAVVLVGIADAARAAGLAGTARLTARSARRLRRSSRACVDLRRAARAAVARRPAESPRSARGPGSAASSGSDRWAAYLARRGMERAGVSRTSVALVLVGVGHTQLLAAIERVAPTPRTAVNIGAARGAARRWRDARRLAGGRRLTSRCHATTRIA